MALFLTGTFSQLALSPNPFAPQNIAWQLLAGDHALFIYLCNLFSGRGHDTFPLQITCKKARIWTFSDWTGNNTDDLRYSDWPKHRHPLVLVDFSLHFCLPINEQNTHASSLWNFCRLSFLEFEEYLNRNFIHWNIFNSVSSFTENCSQKFTDHLNAIWYRLQVTEATNGFTFQMINSWMESWPWLNKGTVRYGTVEFHYKRSIEIFFLGSAIWTYLKIFFSLKFISKETGIIPAKVWFLSGKRWLANNMTGQADVRLCKLGGGWCLVKWMYQALFFSLSSQRTKEAKNKNNNNNSWSQVRQLFDL